MKKLYTKDDFEILVDDDDYEYLKNFTWYRWHRGNCQYAITGYKTKNGKFTTKRMHRMILNVSDIVTVDHINNNGLDNRKENLRKCSLAENLKHRRMHKNNKSGYKGVSYSKSMKKWLMQIMSDGKLIYKFFDDKESASSEYKRLSTELHKEYSCF